MKRFSSLLFVTLGVFAAACGSSSSTAPTTPTNPTFMATLSPANEVPAIVGAEASGTGTSTVTMVTTKDSAGNITSATATFVVNLSGFPAGTPINISHIHQAASGVNGAVVVNSNITAGSGRAGQRIGQLHRLQFDRRSGAGEHRSSTIRRASTSTCTRRSTRAAWRAGSSSERSSRDTLATMHAQCVVAGGGPAGMMLGLLLARAGVRVTVLEKHADFLRDFRGDTIHPSTLELMYELGILDEFLTRPHQEVRQLTGRVAGESVTIADFTHLPTHCKFLVLMPQWDFLDFLAGQARELDTFELRMETEVTGLIEEGGRVAGVRVKTPRRAAGDPRRSRRRRRRPPVGGAPAGGPRGRESRRADRRAVDAAVEAARRPGPGLRLRGDRPHPGDVRSRRLLAVRVRDPEGRIRRHQAARPRGVSRRHRVDRAVHARSRRRARATGTTSSC